MTFLFSKRFCCKLHSVCVGMGVYRHSSPEAAFHSLKTYGGKLYQIYQIHASSFSLFRYETGSFLCVEEHTPSEQSRSQEAEPDLPTAPFFTPLTLRASMDSRFSRWGSIQAAPSLRAEQLKSPTDQICRTSVLSNHPVVTKRKRTQAKIRRKTMSDRQRSSALNLSS